MALVTTERISPEVALITLNDPDSLNAMGETMAAEFRATVDQLRKARRELRAVILTGAGRAFSAGGDLAMLERKAQLSGEENRLLMLDFYGSFLSLLDLGVPLVAAINGHAIGAGLCVAAACDVRVSAKDAKLGFTFTKLGLHPGMGATYFLPKVIGESAARELLLTARVISADEALRLGLVSRVVETADVRATALTIVQEMLQCGPEAVRQLLETLRPARAELDRALQREALAQAINYGGPEFKEGVRATIEKRSPSFIAKI